jgi:hypothetical protein
LKVLLLASTLREFLIDIANGIKRRVENAEEWQGVGLQIVMLCSWAGYYDASVKRPGAFLRCKRFK